MGVFTLALWCVIVAMYVVTAGAAEPAPPPRVSLGRCARPLSRLTPTAALRSAPAGDAPAPLPGANRQEVVAVGVGPGLNPSATRLGMPL
jgi:hypothetical protein